jgi:flagellar export protein FliJ
MSRRFRLAPVERVREARVAEAARALAGARRTFAEAGVARDALAARLASAGPRGVSPEDEALAGYHRAYLRDRLADAETAVAEAARGVDEALAAWHAARSGLRAVEALHERYRATLAAADARREQIVLDDLAAQTGRREALAGAAP